MLHAFNISSSITVLPSSGIKLIASKFLGTIFCFIFATSSFIKSFSSQKKELSFSWLF